MNMHSSVSAVPIGEIVRPIRSWNPRSLTAGEMIDYIDIGSVSQTEKAILPVQPIDAATAPSRARQLVAADDILVSTVRPNLNAVARVSENLDGATASTGFCVLRSDPRHLDPSYLFHWVRAPAFIEEMTRSATGQSYPAVSDKIVKQSTIPLPPLAEQKRIAAILDQADALRRLRRRALDRLNTVGQSIFQEMFGDLLRNDRGWPTMSVRDACEQVVDCVNRTAPVVEYVTHFRMIRTTNVRGGRVDLQNVKYVEEDVFDRWNRRLLPKPGDVILTREAPVGEVGILREDGVFLGQRLFLYRPDLLRITAEFLMYQFRDPFLSQQITQCGMGSTVKHLPLPACENFEVRLPPIELQRMFSERLLATERTFAQQGRDAAKLFVFFASLQHRAFSGQL